MFKLVPKSVSDGLFHLVQKNTTQRQSSPFQNQFIKKKTDSDASWRK